MRTISAVWSSWGPSPQLRTFSHALNMYRRRTLTGWKFNKSGVLVEHQLIFSSFYWRGLPPTPPAEGKMENWCSDNFHNLLGGFVIFTISKHLSHSCPLLCCNCWRLAVWDHVCLSALVDHRPDLRFVKLMIHAFTVKSQLHNRFQESSSIINDQCHSAQVPHLISETVVFLDSNFDCNLLASRTVNL